MIIVKFQGALGNQMFEYALCKRLERVYPDSIIKAYIPDIKDFNGYELDSVFNLSIIRCSLHEVLKLADFYPRDAKFGKMLFKLSRIITYSKPLKYSHVIQEDYTAYYNEIFTLNPLYSYFLDGVWANEKYLEGIQDEIKNIFVFGKELSEKNKKYVEKMCNSNSVAIHVRRNDYISLGITVTSDKYYREAIKYILDNLENPQFFIFSDDHEYCKKLFGNLLEHYEIVEGNTGSLAYRDMQLMSQCKHNIIANSTFSFWGAYLNQNQGKIVIRPNLAFGKLRHPFACKEWVVVDN